MARFLLFPKTVLRSILTPAACSLLLALSFASGCDDGKGGSTDDDENIVEGEGEGDDRPAAPAPEEATPCSGEVNERTCTTADGEDGTSYCVTNGGDETWTVCEETPECYPGDRWDDPCGFAYCAYDREENRVSWYSYQEDECYTPLVVNFERAPLHFEPANGAEFSINGAAGQCVSTDWPTLPWLALDRDHSGTIDSGSELFGSGTVLASGQRASQGFQALAELDHNHDGTIDAQDPAFADLVLWSDLDGDRRGSLLEQTPVTATELEAIHLDARKGDECDNRGNCGGLVSTFEFRAASGERREGEIVDVFLPCR